jgi:hypothetical protein
MTAWGTAAVAVLLAVVPVPGADAKSGYKVYPGGVELVLPVAKKRGSVISVSADGSQRAQFTIAGPSARIEYTTKGLVNSRHIEADFGALGHIDIVVHLDTFGFNPDHKGRCTGRGSLYAEGTYRGSIELFHARGVPESSTKHGRVYFRHRFRNVCKRRLPRRKPGLFRRLERRLEEGILTVRGREEGHTVNMEAAIVALRHRPSRAAGRVAVQVYEKQGEVRIARETGGIVDRGSFGMSKRGENPETVNVKLPKPFVGSALYSQSPDSPPSWTGDLSVDLPGANEVPLTGPGFNAILCRGRVGSCLWKQLQRESLTLW